MISIKSLLISHDRYLANKEQKFPCLKEIMKSIEDNPTTIWLKERRKLADLISQNEGNLK